MADHHAHHDHSGASQGSFWTSRAFLVYLGFAALAVVLLWQEHQDHILGVLPYLFLLACPLMHIFMHGGHGHGGRRNDDGRLPIADQIKTERDGGKS